MRVVLIEDVRGTGKAGDTKEVADGYARNFLIPRKLALAATSDAVERLERQKVSTVQRQEKEVEQARELKTKLESVQVILKVRTGKDGKLFGAVTNADVASALKQQHGITFDRRRIEFAEPVKTLGPATSEIKLHQQVVAQIPLLITNG
jgi:large subunit ribosomal protein L9